MAVHRTTWEMYFEIKKRYKRQSQEMFYEESNKYDPTSPVGWDKSKVDTLL